jgi:hypothetical protein
VFLPLQQEYRRSAGSRQGVEKYRFRREKVLGLLYIHTVQLVFEMSLLTAKSNREGAPVQAKGTELDTVEYGRDGPVINYGTMGKSSQRDGYFIVQADRMSP